MAHGEARFVTCYARWDDDRLVAGNEVIERAWRVERGLLYADSFVDKRTGRQWLARPAQCPAPAPASVPREALPVPTVTTRSGRLFPTHAPCLEIVLRSPTASGEYGVELLVFPGAFGISLRAWFPGDAAGAAAGDPAAAGPTGIEGAAPAESADRFPTADALEHAVLALRHARLTQVTLQDQTDIHNELVFEKEWLLHTAEGALELQGNLFVIEDPLTGDGLIFLKHAPLSHARPIPTAVDFRAAARRGTEFLSGSAAYQPGKEHTAGVEPGPPCAKMPGSLEGAVPPAPRMARSSTDTYGFGFEIGFYGHGGQAAAGEGGYRYVILSYTGGVTGRTTALQRHQRQFRVYRPGRDGMFLSNTWGDRNRDARVTESFVRREIEAGAGLGVDVTQIDDGWQKGRTANSATPGGTWIGFWAADPGFWQTHPERLPNGLGPLVEETRRRGLQFGLWFAPDSANDFANWERDAAVVLDLHRRWDVVYFKIDGVKALAKPAEANLWRFFERVLRESDGRVVFDLDVTAEIRPGYFGMMEVGPLFVENRYTDWHRYWPHQTLRNLWKLAHYVDPARLRMEFLNTSRNAAFYEGDPLAPAQYRADTLFATVMMSSPLGWFEVSNLPPAYVAEVAPLVKTWRKHRDCLLGGTIHPIGAAPDGLAWTGFLSAAPDGRSLYVLAFRELNGSATWWLDLEPGLLHPAGFTAEVLGGRGTVHVEGLRLEITVPEQLDFVFARLA